MTDIERRGGIPAEIRADEDGIKVSGYAAVFGEITDIGGYFREVIERGAFVEAIGRDDVVFVINHDGLPLARTRSGTLRLSEDEHGLHMETVLDPEDPDVKSIVGKMKRGDLDKMSFAFRADVQEWDDAQDPPLRTIKKASLYDVSIVTTPAYDGTSIGLRSLESARAEAEKAREAAQRKKENDLAAKRRIAERRATTEQRIRGIRQDATP
ncbi:HK97 family phage prohead protease [Pseudaminobacter arsenicus]|uniref:HK97 family phage prohead protease n=1 Tax=Borborobacter arsenicus TaxID=1851146 RepID=A0A432VA85_9HYPH|nr:HK97 family phage prohead protease [Pseudaminobacter arsenicus]RUM99026.1 HK97 family phage prohead protease [Pseudaminobacter arsenicus]